MIYNDFFTEFKNLSKGFHFTDNKLILMFAQGVKDVSIFDFTNLYRSQNASRIIQRRGFTLLTG